MNRKKLMILLSAAAVLLAACASPGASGSIVTSTPAGPVTPVPTPNDAPMQPPAAAAAAQAALAQMSRLKPEDIRISKIEEVDWPNSCLGFELPNESCLAAITPGYRILLEAGGKSYEYHTDQAGSVVRLFDQASGGAVNQDQAIETLKKFLASEQQIDVSKITLVKAEKVEFPNACLGWPGKDEMCAEAITPGIRVVLNANGTEYEYRLNADATSARMPGGSVLDLTLANQPGTKGGSMVLVFQTKGSSCEELRMTSVGGQEYGTCGGTLKQNVFPRASWARELKILQETYASFNADTAAGMLEFTGTGSQVPSAAEQRSVAAWAELVLKEANSSTSADQGIAISWHREGGIAGFCDDLMVYRTGFAMPANCKVAKMPASQHLTAAQIDQLTAYTDKFQRFDLEQGNTGADAMTERLVFEGAGQQVPSNADKTEIKTFATDLYVILMKQP